VEAAIKVHEVLPYPEPCAQVDRKYVAIGASEYKLSDKGVVYMQKPVLPSVLLNKVREVPDR
jgi:hypothetical protein